ncbi:23S rRNA (adenine(2030)-N(6))-methyltransferase RlmJ [bacterium]|nr:23S rRNA (adenine(2030)-N(6))-methyltransferase RlmJ [bacterium]MBP5434225.1 23S rRNA (adenine(2030)-N(6))-methyltransferase RlmJ [bacterium]
MFLRISSGELRGRQIRVPETDLRPTSEKVRSALFDSLFSMIHFEDRSFLDIFSGSGIFALEAVSRGFKSAASIEKNPKAAAQIRKSIAGLDLNDRIRAINSDAFLFNYGSLGPQKYSTIFLDPPYALGQDIPTLLDKIADAEIVDAVCVMIVEGDSESDWTREGWNKKTKKFGGTWLTFFYNWE